MTIGGVLLCGGKSTRMGRSKALLPFRGRTMVEQVLATLHQVVGPVVVVMGKLPEGRVGLLDLLAEEILHRLLRDPVLVHLNMFRNRTNQ